LGLGAGFVQKISEDLRGHDKDLGVRSILDVAGHDSDGCCWKLQFQIAELLIGQGFDGGGEKDTLAVCQRFEDGELPDGTFTGTGGGTGEDIVAFCDRDMSILLKGVEGM